MPYTPRLLIAVCVFLCLIGLGCRAQSQPVASADSAIRFTSVPDIFNWNISNPQPGWEDTLDWFFNRLKNEGPDFTLVAGDIMDARWWDDAEQVRRKTEEYWGGFNKRFKDHDMTVYVAPGDHEYGDDGGLERGDIGDQPHPGEKNRPREKVELAEKTKADGPRVTGTLVLEVKADQPNQATTATGWFDLRP